MWKKQLEFLQQTRSSCIRGLICAVTVLSEEPLDTTDLEVHIADVMETLQSLDLRYPIVFIGHSLGSILSINIAERHLKWFSVSLPLP